jgi:8-oxo-dGTP pyrophosphatase MutT (NUDIX family)
MDSVNPVSKQLSLKNQLINLKPKAPTNDLVGAGCLILDKQTNRILVVKGPEKWSLPKGHIDPGELPHETAERETYEETSLVIQLTKDHKSKKLKKYLYYYVILDNANMLTFTPIDICEVSEAKWCTCSELKNLDCNQQLKYFIQRWSNTIKYLYDNEKLFTLSGTNEIKT